MVIAQTLLIAPILAALSRQAMEPTLGGIRRAAPLLRRRPLAGGADAAVGRPLRAADRAVAGFGRASAEVGAVMVVGGNIEGFTRVMTTAIALETSKGDLPLALALGGILMAVVLAVNVAAQLLRGVAARAGG